MPCRDEIDAIFEDLSYWLVTNDEGDTTRVHQLAKKHGASYQGGNRKSGLTFGFRSADNRRSFAAAVRGYAKRAGPIDEKVFGKPSELYGTPKPGKEHIVAAAVRSIDTGDIFLADDHEDAFKLAPLNSENYEDGFYTNRGRFLNRKDALQLAVSTGQGSASEEDNEFEYADGHSHHFYED